ncbi:hypothetical protein JCM11491_005772 [Sporobolomyces phaffii]
MTLVCRASKQNYDSIANTDSSDLDYGVEPQARSDDPHAAFISRLYNIQAQERQTIRVGTWTCWFIRAAPILATLSWTVTLIVLLFAWIFVDKLQTSQATGFPSLSDAIARHTTVALCGGGSTGAFLFQSLAQERILRYQRVLVEATEEKWLWHAVGTLDCFLGLCASVSMIVLPIFDVKDSRGLRVIFKATFFASLGLSGLLNAVEVEHLWHEHPDRHDLRVGTFLKYTFISLFIASGATSRLAYQLCRSNVDGLREVINAQCYRTATASAILEWVTCFSISGFLSTLALDVWPLSRHCPVHPQFSASTQGLTHVHYDVDNDHCGDVAAGPATSRHEIPPGLKIRRVPVLERAR